ncbi:phosphonoacetaldehyde hydrolase [Bartonella sp. HY038]|uniref:phosphonoacetaldehyde hydrolase n=1 Tax=Bartonella sp. HY038 TaxID=2759660 RepID=UPI0015FC76F9|nr:phosphonoacetaldehyde hydrolase [Bartonella sp. HY038]
MTQLKAAIFDWAGTTIDFGSFAPMGVFVESFKAFDIDISIGEARAPMGLPKRDHIVAVLNQPRIAKAWQDTHGKTADNTDIDAIYAHFLPLNEAIVHNYASLIPGTLEVVAELRRREMKIGSTTGYTRSIMERVLPLTKAQGYEPDNLVCAGDLPFGRPTPLNMYQCFLDLCVWPAHLTVKIDDTGVGIMEGVAAGSWTIGLALSGNEAALSLADYEAMDKNTRNDLMAKIAPRLKAAGAHYVIETIADLIPVIDDIEQRLKNGERPF